MRKDIDEIVDNNFNYIEKNALKYVGFGVSFDDLVQVSFEALLRAIKNYKHTGNFKEYFNIYIHRYLTECIIKVNCIHFTPVSYYIDIFKILKSKKEGYLTYDEIHKRTSLSYERIKECCHFIKEDLSLGDVEFQDSYSVEFDVIDNIYDRLIIEKFLNNNYVSAREKKIIMMRYGFYGKLYSVYEIASILNISHQRVSALEKQGIVKFRNYLLMIGYVNPEEFRLKCRERIKI